MRPRLSRLVGTRFQVLFHSPPGVLFTFPSRYLSAIGHQGVFRLSGWSRRIHTEFHGLGATWETRSGGAAFSCTGLSPSTATPSRGLPLTTTLSHSPSPRQKRLSGPTTPPAQPLPGITCKRFRDRKSTRLNSSHANISYAVFCLKKKHTKPYDMKSPNTRIQ